MEIQTWIEGIETIFFFAFCKEPISLSVGNTDLNRRDWDFKFFKIMSQAYGRTLEIQTWIEGIETIQSSWSAAPSLRKPLEIQTWIEGIETLCFLQRTDISFRKIVGNTDLNRRDWDKSNFLDIYSARAVFPVGNTDLNRRDWDTSS